MSDAMPYGGEEDGAEVLCSQCAHAWWMHGSVADATPGCALEGCDCDWPRPVTTMEYPSEDDLRTIAEWPPEDPVGWLAYVRGCWWAADWGWHEVTVLLDEGRTVHRHLVSTGGWSGNESLIGAMQANRLLWVLTWQLSRRGGHHVFDVQAEDEKHAED